MDSEALLIALKAHRKDFDYKYHFEKIEGDLRQVILKSFGESKLTFVEKMINRISWYGLGIALISLFMCYTIYKLYIPKVEINQDYNKCVFTAIERLQSSADIISLCKEFKK